MVIRFNDKDFYDNDLDLQWPHNYLCDMQSQSLIESYKVWQVHPFVCIAAYIQFNTRMTSKNLV